METGGVLASEFRDAGLTVHTQSFEWGTFYGDVQHGRFQLALMRWVGTIDPDLYRKSLASSEVPPHGLNRGSFSNAEFDRLVEKGAEMDNFNQRKLIYNEVQKIALEEMPIIPLWYNTEVTVLSKNVTGYVPSLTGDYWPLIWAEKKK
jgi:peptide/nickel transport system substrate-binding protein